MLLHFGRFNMEVHAGMLDTSAPVPKVVKESKTEVLFCSAPLHTYSDPSTFDGADLSHVLIPGDRFMPIVEQFPYLGDIVARDGGDAAAIDSRISAAGKGVILRSGAAPYHEKQKFLLLSAHAVRSATASIHRTNRRFCGAFTEQRSGSAELSRPNSRDAKGHGGRSASVLLTRRAPRPNSISNGWSMASLQRVRPAATAS